MLVLSDPPARLARRRSCSAAISRRLSLICGDEMPSCEQGQVGQVNDAIHVIDVMLKVHWKK